MGCTCRAQQCCSPQGWGVQVRAHPAHFSVIRRGPALHSTSQISDSSLPIPSLSQGQDQPLEKSLLLGFSISSLLLNCQSWKQHSLDTGISECSHPLMGNDLCDAMWDTHRAGSSHWTHSMSGKMGQHCKTLLTPFVCCGDLVIPHI